MRCGEDMTTTPESKHRAVAWLELVCALSVLTLVFQLFPTIRTDALWALNVRHWPRMVWFAGTLVILFILVVIRVGPELLQEWRQRRERLDTERKKLQKQLDLKEQRIALEEMRRALSRRIY